MIHRASNVFSRFLTDKRGTVTIEFIIVFPMLIWAFIGIFLYWDAHKAINLSQKASFTVADNLSRTQTPLAKSHIDGLSKLLAYLADADPALGEGVRLRVTSIRWNNTDKKHEVSWSYSAYNAEPVLTTAKLVDIKDQLPTLTEFETVLLIETEVDFVPALGKYSIFANTYENDDQQVLTMGIDRRSFAEFVVIRPRFIPKVCLASMATCT
jgi:hypothetical protein